MTFKQRFAVGWRLLRPFTLTASIVPVLIGTGLGITVTNFHSGLFFAFLIASMLIQSATNMFNEYFDFARGLDSDRMVGIAGTIVKDGVRPRTVLTLGWAFTAVSVVLGVYICASTTWWIAAVGTACLGVAYLYSGGPKPLSSTPFGELAAAIAMGPVIVLLAFYVQAHEVTAPATAVSIPIGLLIGAILLGNNIRDMDEDKLGGRKTIAILLGREKGRILFVSVFIVAYIVVLILIGFKILTVWALLVLLTIPSAIYPAKLFFRFSEPAKLHPAVKGTSKLLFQFGTLLFIGMVASIWYPIVI